MRLMSASLKTIHYTKVISDISLKAGPCQRGLRLEGYESIPVTGERKTKKGEETLIPMLYHQLLLCHKIRQSVPNSILKLL